MFFLNCLGSKLNFLANCSCSFASFIETDVPREERLLVLIGATFLIFKPNGQIHSEVEIRDKKLRQESSLSIRDVSANSKYFVFNYISKVFHLGYDEKRDRYYF